MHEQKDGINKLKEKIKDIIENKTFLSGCTYK